MHADVVLHADVEALGVLTDQHQIDVLVATPGHERPNGTDVRV